MANGFYRIFVGMLTILMMVVYASTPQSNNNQCLPQGVSIYQLDNGLQVLLIENRGLPMVGANMVVKVGSAYETFATSGMSHMLEHLLFNGTKSKSQKELYDAADRIGGYNNANTGEFYTNFMMVTPAEHIEKGMGIQADMLFNSILPVKKFAKEKGIVLEEISKTLVRSSEQIARNSKAVLFPNHGLSLPTLGTYATIEHMNRDEVNTFYSNNYVPNNMILSVIGNFETQKMRQMIEKIYGQAKPGTVLRGNTSDWGLGFSPLVVQNNKSNQVVHRFYEGKKTVVEIIFPFEGVANSMLDLAMETKMDQLKTILKNEFPKAYQDLKFSSKFSSVASFGKFTLILNVDIDYKKLKLVLLDSLKGLDLVLPAKLVEAEIAKTRTSFLKNIEKPHMFGIYNAETFAQQGIEAVLASYDSEGMEKDAQALAFFAFASAPITIVHHPSVANNNEKATKIRQAKLFKNNNGGSDLISVENKASKLLAIHFLVKQKAKLEKKYGKDAGKILHDCFKQRLETAGNKEQSARFGLTYVVNDNPWIPMDNIYLHPDFGYLRFEALAEFGSDISSFIQKRIKGFTPTKNEFDKAMESTKQFEAMMGGGKKGVKAQFTETYKNIIYANHNAAENKELTWENLKLFATEYFQPANMIVSIVSPQNTKTIKKQWKTFISKKVTGQLKPQKLILKNNKKEVVFDISGGGKRSYLYWGYTKSIKEDEKAALHALSLILSKQIAFEIREKQGKAYRITSGIEMRENKAIFFINQGSRPENVESLLGQYTQFFTYDAVKNLTDADIEKSINMYMGRMMFRRLSSINQAYYLGHSLYFQNDLNYDADYLQKLKMITLADVKKVAKKYLKPKNIIKVVYR